MSVIGLLNNWYTLHGRSPALGNATDRPRSRDSPPLLPKSAGPANARSFPAQKSPTGTRDGPPRPTGVARSARIATTLTLRLELIDERETLQPPGLHDRRRRRLRPDPRRLLPASGPGRPEDLRGDHSQGRLDHP